MRAHILISWRVGWQFRLVKSPIGKGDIRAPGRRVARAFLDLLTVLGRLALASSPIGALGLGRSVGGSEPGPMVPTFMSLGDVALFVGTSPSISVTASNFPGCQTADDVEVGGCHANSIYFANHGHAGLYVFNLNHNTLVVPYIEFAWHPPTSTSSAVWHLGKSDAVTEIDGLLPTNKATSPKLITVGTMGPGSDPPANRPNPRASMGPGLKASRPKTVSKPRNARATLRLGALATLCPNASFPDWRL